MTVTFILLSFEQFGTLFDMQVENITQLAALIGWVIRQIVF